MADYGLPILYALFVWWFSTGLIIYLDGLPRHTVRWSMLGATAVLILSLYGLAASSTDTSVFGAYQAFTWGLLIWGWHTISFYSGFLTGPRKTACPETCKGWRHFVHGVEACLYHELAIIATAVGVVALTWGNPNQIGMWTFVVLWLMHQSAKLNVFLGVRNLNEELLPRHLAYLKSFLTRKPMNWLFPISVTVSTVVTIMLIERIAAPTATAFEIAGYSFLVAMMILGLLEHWLLVIPMQASALWKWALKSHRKHQWDDPPAASVDRPSALREWSARLDGRCDRDGLHRLLEAVASGAYGDVRRIEGIARVGSGWIRFDMAGGRSSVTAFAPRDSEEARVVAIGAKVDEARLRAAFEACAA